MARRLDIELTSTRDDGTWTWRAAGAREPRGVIEPKLLDENAKVGDVLRVEAQFELEGITVLSVLPARQREEPRNRIEVMPRSAEGVGAVTTSLVSKKGRDGATERTDRPKRERRPGAPSRPPRQREPGSRGEAGEARRPARPRSVVSDRVPREPTRRSASLAPRRGATDAESGSGQGRAPAPRRTRTRPARLVPGTRHRDEYLTALAPEQRVVAEQLAVGGLPAVRKAIAQDREAAVASGRPDARGDAVVELAEQLLPGVRRAVWLDRAEAAVEHLDTISLRDLRAVVVGGTARDDHARELLAKLREALQGRVEKQRAEWEAEITQSLGEHRVLHALRLSARAPDPGARISTALVAPLAEAASAALTASTPADRWLALLEASAASPVRRAVKPEGIPEDPSGGVRHAAVLAAGRISALAPMLGLAIPPPPRPSAASAKPVSERRTRADRRPRSRGTKEREQTTRAPKGPTKDSEDRAEVDGLSAVDRDDVVVDEPSAQPVDEVESVDVGDRDEASIEGIVPGARDAPGDHPAGSEVADQEALGAASDLGRADEVSDLEL